MKIREANIYRGAMIQHFGATDIFATHVGVSVSTINRILRGDCQLTENRRAKWDNLLGISRQWNATSTLVCEIAPAIKLQPGPGGLGT